MHHLVINDTSMNTSYQQLTVAIIGRPNVGKSTFFNRLIGKRKAIESDSPGTTRDRIYGEVNWVGKTFKLIDTAGLFDTSNFSKLTDQSIEAALEEADSIIFMIDTNDITNIDREVAKSLHKIEKQIFLVANKADNSRREIFDHKILSLGFGEPKFISAISGRGVGDFLDLITKDMVEQVSSMQCESIIKTAIIGRPNVGKSTLLNSLAGVEKAIVSDIPGTTRDATDTTISYDGKQIQFVDTAGIRRRGKVSSGIEKYSVLRSIQALEQAELAIMLIDIDEGLTNQDAHLIGNAKNAGKSIIIVINKFDIWDDIEEKNKKTMMAKMLSKIQADLAFVPFVPVIFLSAKTGKNQNVLLKKIIEIWSQRFIKIPNEQLTGIIKIASDRNAQLPGIINFTQERVNPPIFKLFCKNKKLFHFSHLRYLENIIRDKFPYFGTPIFIDLIDQKER